MIEKKANSSDQSVLVLTSTYRENEESSTPGFVNTLSGLLAKHFKVKVLTQHIPGQEIEETDGAVRVKRYRYGPEFLEVLSDKGGIAASIKANKYLLALVPALLLSQIFNIARETKSAGIDIVHAHWIIPQGFAAVIAKLFFRLKTKIVITVHGGDLFGFNGRVPTYLKKFTLARADGICVVSQPMKTEVAGLIDKSDKDIYVHPMGVDLDNTFNFDHGSERVRGSIVFVGRLVEKKGACHLINSLRVALKKQALLNLLIIGNGPEREELEKMAKELDIIDRVRFLGGLSQRDVAAQLKSAEMAVFPFVRASNGDMEGLGLSAIEAMGCGTPVIVGNVPAVHDFIEHNKTGLLCNPEDHNELGNQILALHEDDTLRLRLAKAGKEFVNQRFSWNASTSNYVELFRSWQKH